MFFLQDLNVSLANWMKPCLMLPITEVFIIQFVFSFSHTQRESYSALTERLSLISCGSGIPGSDLPRVYYFLSMKMELYDMFG